jgi:hypothetical protein
MATHVKFLSFTPITIGNLRPTPNVGEWEAISAALAADTSPRLEPTPTDLEGKELKIIASYRSAAMWVEGGVSFTREWAKTEGGNGYSGWPPAGLKEKVLLRDWTAEVEFV